MLEVRQSRLFTEWFDKLCDRRGKARIAVRVQRLQEGNPGQHRILSGGVAEMKVDFGPGYRVYFTRRSAEVVLLPIGGDKASQRNDIDLAMRLAKEWTS